MPLNQYLIPRVLTYSIYLVVYVILPPFIFLYRNVEIVPFFKVLEGDRNIKDMIVDYSISQTTLEEVFLNVSVFT